MERTSVITDCAARYWARKAGLRCCKPRGKVHINNHGGYRLLDQNNNVVAGLHFDLSAEEVKQFAFDRLNIGTVAQMGTEN
jgi:hypothetical protein